MKLTVTVDNLIGMERAAIVMRDEARLLNHFARAERVRTEPRAITWDGNSMGLPVRSRSARVHSDLDHVHLSVDFEITRSMKVRLSRATIEEQLRDWLADRFERRYPIHDTKVFGIGFQRTGTTSLLDALRLLGYFGIHNAPWLLPGILEGDPDWTLVDEYDAFADNPFPLLFRELDERHPASKFILTERATEDWLKSVRYLVEELGPGFEMERRIYGVDGFDPAIFAARYAQHSQDVREHFADRPDSLLILEVGNDDAFERLGKFLGVPAPVGPFPHSGSSRR